MYDDDELVDVMVVLDGKSVYELYGLELGGLTKAALNASEKLHCSIQSLNPKSAVSANPLR